MADAKIEVVLLDPDGVQPDDSGATRKNDGDNRDGGAKPSPATPGPQNSGSQTSQPGTKPTPPKSQPANQGPQPKEDGKQTDLLAGILKKGFDSVAGAITRGIALLIPFISRKTIQTAAEKISQRAQDAVQRTATETASRWRGPVPPESQANQQGNRRRRSVRQVVRGMRERVTKSRPVQFIRRQASRVAKSKPAQAMKRGASRVAQSRAGKAIRRATSRVWYGKRGTSVRKSTNPFVGMSGAMGQKAQATRGAAAGGLSRVAAAAMANPIIAAGAALTAFTVGLLAVSKILQRQADELEEYSGAIAGARSQIAGQQMENKLERAQKIGPAVAQVELAKGRMDDAMYDLWTEILSIVSGAAPAIEVVADVIVVLLRAGETGVNLLQAIANAVTGNFVGAYREVGEAGESAEKFVEALKEVFIMQGEGDADDAIVQMILTHDPLAAGNMPRNANPQPPGGP